MWIYKWTTEPWKIYLYISRLTTCMYVVKQRTILVHVGQTQDPWKVPEAVKVVVCGWTGATWATGNCQLLHRSFQGFIKWNIACQERYIAHCWVPLLPCHLPHCNMSTPSQYPCTAGELSVVLNGSGQGEAKRQVRCGAAPYSNGSPEQSGP